MSYKFYISTHQVTLLQFLCNK